jgi:hypothetical protein
MPPVDPLQSFSDSVLPTFYDVAANDDGGPVAYAHGRPHAVASPSAGWDPYEVWRTRVRDPRRAAERPTAS